MSKERRKKKEKQDAIETDRQMDADKEPCPVCGTSIGKAMLDLHIKLTHG